MRVLLVGGASFIGAYTVRRLLRLGHTPVVYDLNITDNSMQRVLEVDEIAGLVRVLGDVLDSLRLIETAIEHRVDAVVHLAALLGPQSAKNPSLATQVNCDGFNHSLEVARILGLRRVVWASSTGVYGRPSRYKEDCPNEDAPLFPPTVYGATKAFNEHVAAHYHEHFGVDTIGLRFPIVYGPGRLRGALPYELWVELIEKPLANEPGRVPMGDTSIDWQYVEDSAEVIVAALMHEGATRHRVFNTHGEVRTVREAVETVRELIPSADVEALPGVWDVFGQLDTRRVQGELGFHPRYTLDMGFEASLEVLRR